MTQSAEHSSPPGALRHKEGPQTGKGRVWAMHVPGLRGDGWLEPGLAHNRGKGHLQVSAGTRDPPGHPGRPAALGLGWLLPALGSRGLLTN